jgi:hypothetical protein
MSSFAIGNDDLYNAALPVADWFQSWAGGLWSNVMGGQQGSAIVAESTVTPVPERKAALADEFQTPVIIAGVVLVGLAFISWRR